MPKTLAEHLDPTNGPKRILSLDGGGIRGALTTGYLKKIETIVREKEGNPNLLLCDYFDLIGGTSTGAIIATLLALGKTADEIKDLYMELGGEIFGEKRDWWKPWETFNYFRAEFSEKALEKSLKKYVQNLTVGSAQIKTGLCIVAKRADTNSVWPLINHPKGRYYEKNKNIPLWQALRATSAAPTYFIPQMVDVGDGQIGAFVDGGVSMANNPALTLLMVATLKGFPYHWELGEKKIELVSLGTGFTVYQKHSKDIDEAWLGTWAKSVPDMLMQDASWQNQIMLQWLSNSPTAAIIDREIGNLEGDLIAGKPQLKYLRYNFPITQNDLNGLELILSKDDLKALEIKDAEPEANGKDFKITFTQKNVDSLAEMSNSQNKELLYKIGVAASKEILKEHF
jgi:uncharacterized protein